MAHKPETKFKIHVVSPALRKLPNTWFVKIQQVALRGTPDYILCVNGNFVALELKPDEFTEPDELQKYNISKIHDSGGVAIVAYPENWDKIYNILSELAVGKLKIKLVKRTLKEELQ